MAGVGPGHRGPLIPCYRPAPMSPARKSSASKKSAAKSSKGAAGGKRSATKAKPEASSRAAKKPPVGQSSRTKATARKASAKTAARKASTAKKPTATSSAKSSRSGAAARTAKATTGTRAKGAVKKTAGKAAAAPRATRAGSSARKPQTGRKASRTRAVKPPHFDKKTLEALKVRLTKEREDLKRQLVEIDEESFEGTQSDLTGEVGLDEDFADAGTATFDRERALSIQNNVRDLMDQVTGALRRIDEGTYGICERCGKPVEPARLKALPYASLCMDCKRREERAR